MKESQEENKNLIKIVTEMIQNIGIGMKIQDISHMSDLEKVTGQGYFVTSGRTVTASPSVEDGQ